ncbi:MAG: hypothetical protein JSS87_08815 [Acidobacteria bacterium]|nr:hypothetical protein [Acidobacteriota bacterium]
MERAMGRARNWNRNQLQRKESKNGFAYLSSNAEEVITPTSEITPRRLFSKKKLLKQSSTKVTQEKPIWDRRRQDKTRNTRENLKNGGFLK